VTQHESPFYKNDAVAMQRAHKRIIEFFDINYVYQAHIPTYPSGHWLFGFSSKKYHPIRDINQTAWETLNLKTKYYNTTLHKGAFCLPTYVKELLENAE
jgi:spermidine synthase